MGVSRDCPKFFLVSPIISGMGKATNFKFGGDIYRANPNKNPLKFWRKGSLGVSRDCQNFFAENKQKEIHLYVHVLRTPYYLRNG